MGATNQIKGTNLSLQLEGKKCPQCQQVFTKQDLDERNWECWFDTTNDVKLIPMEKIEEKMDRLKLAEFNRDYWDLLYYPFGRTGYQFSIWIRSIEHEYCPNTELCNRCEDRFLTKKMKEFKGNYYCSPCYQSMTDKKPKCEQCSYDTPLGTKICPSCWLEAQEKQEIKKHD